MPVRIYRDKQIRLEPLRGKICGVIGFGSQGHAHALNLRDSGFEVVVGLHRGSKSRSSARAHKLAVLETSEAARQSDIVFLALPDTKMPKIFAKQIAPYLRRGQTLLFAHGFTVAYRIVDTTRNGAVMMVAPEGLGHMVRREFIEGRGVPDLVAVGTRFKSQ